MPYVTIPVHVTLILYSYSYSLREWGKLFPVLYIEQANFIRGSNT